MKYEKIDHPTHYQSQTIEAIDVIDSYNLNFCLGSATKYILRAGKKPGEDTTEDLKKALWYVQRELLMRPQSYWNFFSWLKTKPQDPLEIAESFDLPPHLHEALEVILLASQIVDRSPLLRTAIGSLQAQIDLNSHPS